MSRRDLLAAGGAGAVALSFGSLFPQGARAGIPRGAYPFVAGVASGEPAPDGIVLWTRLQFDSLGAQQPTGQIPVGWELANDEQMTQIVARGTQTAIAKEGHSVHVEVPNLQPGREYWYRFYAAGEASATGRTKTAPAYGSPPSSMRLCLVSCQNFENGYFTAYRHIVEDDPDVVVHVGDYIYEGGPGTDPARVRTHATPEPMDLPGYRQRYGQYHSDADLLEARRLIPFVVTPDDHEVENNYAGLISEVDNEPDQDPKVFAKRRAAAYQAYYEWQPLRLAQHPQGSGMQLYRELPFGDLVDVVVADTRQFRTDQPYNDKPPADGPDMTDPKATLPGIPQEQWLVERMGGSKGKWTLLAQQVLMASHDLVPGAAKGYSTDQWDAYRASRTRVLRGIQNSQCRNPVVLTGDIHQHYGSDLLADFADPSSAIVASELCGTSVSTGGNGSDKVDPQLAENPWIKFNSSRRGYVRVTMDDKQLLSDFRVLDSVTTGTGQASTRGSYTLLDGQKGLKA